MLCLMSLIVFNKTYSKSNVLNCLGSLMGLVIEFGQYIHGDLSTKTMTKEDLILF